MFKYFHNFKVLRGGNNVPLGSFCVAAMNACIYDLFMNDARSYMTTPRDMSQQQKNLL